MRENRDPRQANNRTARGREVIAVRSMATVVMATFWMVAAGFGMCAYGSNEVPNPHARFNMQGKCGSCHQASDKNGMLPEHLLAENVEKLCCACHDKSSLGNSHPVNVRPGDVSPDMSIPENLPLDEDGLITCVTCHNPHLPYYTRERFFATQNPLFCTMVVAENIEPECYFRTYFLRVSEIDAGNDPLCRSCHASY